MIYKLTSTTILVIGLLINANGQDSLKLASSEEFGKQVLIAFKSNNFELFESLFITESKQELIINKIQASDSLKSVYRQQGIANIKYLHKQARQNFENILIKAKSNNLDWAKTEFIEVKLHPRSKNEVERADIIIYAKSKSSNFVIVLANSCKSDVWHIMNKVELNIIN
jgi:hypothetical protein